MYRAYKYRLYPDKEQSVMFAKTFGCCRKVWNLMLADKISIYKETGKIVTVTPARYKKTEIGDHFKGSRRNLLRSTSV